MYSAQDFLLDQSKLLSCRKLPLTGEAGEARQVVDVAFSPADPVSSMDVPPAAGAAGPIPPGKQRPPQGEGKGTDCAGRKDALGGRPGCGSAAETHSGQAGHKDGGHCSCVLPGKQK